MKIRIRVSWDKPGTKVLKEEQISEISVNKITAKETAEEEMEKLINEIPYGNIGMAVAYQLSKQGDYDYETEIIGFKRFNKEKTDAE